MPRLPPLKVKWCEYEVDGWPKPCAVPGLTVCFHQEAKLMGRGAYTRVCKWKVMVDDPRTELRWFGVIPDGCNQMLWHKCATSAECRTIRIAASTVTDGWKGHTVSDGISLKMMLKDDGEMTCGGLNWNHHLNGGNDTNVPTWVS